MLIHSVHCWPNSQLSSIHSTGNIVLKNEKSHRSFGRFASFQIKFGSLIVHHSVELNWIALHYYYYYYFLLHVIRKVCLLGRRFYLHVAYFLQSPFMCVCVSSAILQWPRCFFFSIMQRRSKKWGN